MAEQSDFQLINFSGSVCDVKFFPNSDSLVCDESKLHLKRFLRFFIAEKEYVIPVMCRKQGVFWKLYD